jgi:antitoxin component YwqK of YwqJK toxin-antitoxin module
VQQFYREGKRYGPRKYWYDNGQLEARMWFRDGEFEGKREFWYRNGNPEQLMFFQNGENGKCIDWNENGVLVRSVYVRDRKIVCDKFDLKKRCAILSIKRFFRSRFSPIIDIYIISDLSSVICQV